MVKKFTATQKKKMTATIFYIFSPQFETQAILNY